MSGVGTSATSAHVRFTAAFGGKADLNQHHSLSVEVGALLS
jgi:hypothetical protein